MQVMLGYTCDLINEGVNMVCFSPYVKEYEIYSRSVSPLSEQTEGMWSN